MRKRLVVGWWRSLFGVLVVAAIAGSLSVVTTRAASATVGGSPAAPASGTLYWTNGRWIGTADLNGKHVDQQLIAHASPFFSGSIAVFGDYLYWANAGTLPIKKGGGTIGRARLDGTDVDRNFITGASLPAGVTVDGGYIYWANNLAGAIGRARLDGTEVNQRFITTAQPEGPDDVVVGGGYIYWANDFNIGRAEVNGTHVDQNFIAVPNGPSGVSGVAVTSRYIYWTDETAGRIGRALLNGTDIDQRFITGAHFPEGGLAVDAHYVYWANNNSSTIGRAKLNGTHVDERFITVTRQNLFGLAVDPGEK